MAFQAVPNAAEIVIGYTGHGQEFKNVIHAFLVGGYSLGDLEDLALAVDAAVGLNWLPIQGNDYAYINTTVRGLAFVNDQEAINDDSAATATGGTGGVPDNVTLSVKKSSGLTGRGARGRLYWIGTRSTDLATNENVYDATAVSDIVDAIEDVRVAINATAWVAAIVSRFLDGVPRGTGATFAWLASAAVNNNVDSQRGRLIE